MRKIFATVVFAAACGGGSSNNKQIDAGHNPDAGDPIHHDAPLGADAMIDGPADALDAFLGGCLVATNFGTVTPNVPTTFEDTDPPTDHIEYDDNLNNDTRPDQIAISLWPGFGIFTNTPVGPGTYTITGAETNMNTCGACVEIFADVDPNAGSDGHYQAQSGTLVITSISGRFTGTLTNATLVRDDSPDGCSTHIDTLAVRRPMPPSTAARRTTRRRRATSGCARASRARACRSRRLSRSVFRSCSCSYSCSCSIENAAITRSSTVRPNSSPAPRTSSMTCHLRSTSTSTIRRR
jgi:hypothetical protein